MYYAFSVALLVLAGLLAAWKNRAWPLQVTSATAAGIPLGFLGPWADNAMALQQIYNALAVENRPVIIRNALANSTVEALRAEAIQLRFKPMVSGRDMMQPFGTLGAERWKHLAIGASCGEVEDALGGKYAFRFRQAAKNVTHAHGVNRLRELFSSQPWLRFVAALAGAADRKLWWQEQGLTHFGIGDFIAPHSDDAPNRLVAFVLYLGRQSDQGSTSGGELVWCASKQRVHATSNTLLVFRVDPMAPSEHMVLPPVSMFERVAMTGWLSSRDESYAGNWHRTGPTPPRVSDLLVTLAI